MQHLARQRGFRAPATRLGDLQAIRPRHAIPRGYIPIGCRNQLVTDQENRLTPQRQSTRGKGHEVARQQIGAAHIGEAETALPERDRALHCGCQL